MSAVVAPAAALSEADSKLVAKFSEAVSSASSVPAALLGAYDEKLFKNAWDDAALRMAKTVPLTGADPQAKRAEIRQYFHQTFTLYERLFEVLKDSQTVQMRPEPLRHPLIFYWGHTAVFFINKLRLSGFVKQRLNPKFESMLAIGVDEMSWDDLSDNHYDWPTFEDVRDYRNLVRATVDNLIMTQPLSLPITWDSMFWIILMGCEHERIHLETSSVLFRQLPLEQVHPHKLWPSCPQVNVAAPANKLIAQPAAQVNIGKSSEHRYYGWDNEYGTHIVDVKPFKASKFLVSNQEYLEFVLDNGYTTEKWWTDEGWRWRNYRKCTFPYFWREVAPAADGTRQWKLRLFTEEINMPWSWPVEVVYLEAKAFCNWKAAKTGLPIRLPSEEEWAVLRNRYIEGDLTDWKTGAAPGNINLEYWASSCPVNMFGAKPIKDVRRAPESPTAAAAAAATTQADEKNDDEEVFDIQGNVWQHSESAIDGFPGFKVHPMYDDFSVPTFDTKHNLIKGGSWISTGNEATYHSRYAFRRHFIQHAGFRYVESDAPVTVNNDLFEADPVVAQQAEYHYGDMTASLSQSLGVVVPHFPTAVAQLALQYVKQTGTKTTRAMDLGCSVGRSSFELAKAFDYVFGIDFSTRFIRLAVQLQTVGAVRYEVPGEGDVKLLRERQMKDLGLVAVSHKCEFGQADACNLDLKKHGNFDLLLAANLIEHLYEPSKFLERVHQFINPNGLLVLSSTNNWDETVTPKKSWVGGYKGTNGEWVFTIAGLRDILKSHFREVAVTELPLVMHTKRRRFVHDLCEVSVWQRLQDKDQA